MNTFKLSLLVLVLAAACSGGDKNPVVTFSDAGPADARPAPDAAPCPTTVCEATCVDTASDPFHCGGCGMACNSPGQLCSGSLPCACPTPFVPALIGGTLDQIQTQGPIHIGLSPVINTTFDLMVLLYDLSLETNVEYDFVDSATALAPPAIAAGYDVSISDMTARTAYAAFTGTIIFDSICETGASGTLSNVVFSEIQGITNPAPVANGCTMSYETLDFDIGNCTEIPSDAGVADAGVIDAGGA